MCQTPAKSWVKYVKTMASFASVRHHIWRTQAAWTKNLGSEENLGPKFFLVLTKFEFRRKSLAGWRGAW